MSDVFVWDEDERIVNHHKLDEEEVIVRRKRKLVEYNMTSGCCSMGTEREVRRVLSMGEGGEGRVGVTGEGSNSIIRCCW